MINFICLFWGHKFIVLDKQPLGWVDLYCERCGCRLISDADEK